MSVIDEPAPRLGLQMGKRFALAALLIVLLTAGAVSSAILLEAKQDVTFFRSQSEPIKGIGNVLDDVPQGQPQTILLLGSDKRYADGKDNQGRSDTIIVVRLDPDKKATAIMSLPRDLKVQIPGYGTNKLNAAYHFGGPKLTVRTVRNLLGIRIHHVINVNFGGFSRAVNRLGCVYADVDRRYFNDNSHGENYAVIDLKPGYQKLCGQNALDYVRFRHADSDIVRAARQQEFLRQAKEQFGLGKLFGDRQRLLTIFGRYTQTDISEKNTAAILNLIKLAYQASRTPLREIKFPAQDAAEGFLDISPASLATTVKRFVEVRGRNKTTKKKKKVKKKRAGSRKGLAAGLVYAEQEGEDNVLATHLKLRPRGLPVYYPKVRLALGGLDNRDSPRAYRIFDRNHNRYFAYRIVYSQSVSSGQYYGVQGTTWKAAPILDNPTDEVTIGKRRYKRYFDGSRIRLIAWETPHAVYWVTNTLSQELSNKQMEGIATSLQRVR